MRYDLYINDQLCDLDDESLIVLTYTMEQLTNPTAVKNTYSHEVELPQTKRNDEIFAHFYRNDYNAVGYNFEPTAQVPFVIYNELGEIAESGYIKLDEISIDKAAHKYKVSLYGGLGSFFASLAFNESGDALALYDLDYMSKTETGYSESDLNLRISRSTILSAWNKIAGSGSNTAYDVINFAPMYQGLPNGEFDADKALFIGRSASKASTPDAPIYGITAPQGSNGYYKRLNKDGTDTGFRIALVKLNDKHNEWEMQDLRSYLQRPVLSVKKFVEAVQRRAVETGFKLNLDSSFFNANNPYYDKAWLTLPSLQSFVRNRQEVDISLSAVLNIDGSLSQTFPIEVSGGTLPTYEVGVTIKEGSAEIYNICVAIDEAVRNYGAGSYVNTYRLSNKGGIYAVAWFVQIYGMSNGRLTAWSNVCILSDSGRSAENILENTGFVAKGSGVKYDVIDGYFKTYEADKTKLRFTKSLEFSITAANTYDDIEWYIHIDKQPIANTTMEGNQLLAYYTHIDDEGNYLNDIKLVDMVEGADPSHLSGKASLATNESVRSGSVVLKKELLNIGKTPLEVLLSYCKLFGLIWQYDNKNNEINLMPRSAFYSTAGVEDWSERIDRSRAVTIKPFVFDKRFYDLSLEALGEWTEEYEQKYGAVYGRQRIDTGYSFDRESKNLLEGNALKGGAEVLKQSKYFCNIEQGTYTLGGKTYSKICPSVFLDGGKYSLYNNGTAAEYDITTPTAEASITYYNQAQGYDWLAKLDMQNDGKLIEDSGTLLIHTGNVEIAGETPYRNLRLTDDVAEMSILNDGVPCWVIEGSVYGSLDGDYIPHFVRVGDGVSLDMGVPQEIDNPNPDMLAVENTIYAQYWRNYLGDRYDKNSRVLTAYVDLRGLQVDNKLFRKFYYFDNAYWVLNKISNYSITTEGTTQCEFVKVQDMKNYKGE